MRWLCLTCLAASPLFAQYGEFAVTDDGRLYFDSTQTTGPEDARFKIYSADAPGIRLLTTGPGTDTSNFGPGAIYPLTSGDGAITGYAINYPCRNGSCGLSGLPRTFFQLNGIDLQYTTYNTLQISRNGRYLLGARFDSQVQVVELPSQKARVFARGLFVPGPQAIDDGGGALLWDVSGDRALLYASLDGDPAPIPGTAGAASAILSPAGDRVAFERSGTGWSELVLTDRNGAAQVIARFEGDGSVPWPQYPQSWSPSFANDGTLLFLNAGHPVIAHPGEEPRRLTTVELAAVGAILSGNGRVAWLSTGSGQLLRVEVETGAVQEVVPETPLLYGTGEAALPGSVLRFFGSGASPRTRFVLGDETLPLAEIRDPSIAVQVPWEYRGGSTRLSVSNPASPFVQYFAVSLLREPTITFERGFANGALQVAHQDFSGPVTAAQPARPGETVHVFARNLGAVDRPVATGERSPTSPPARVTSPLACYLFPKQEPGGAAGLVVPFAGLAGGSIGIYQIDVTVPADWSSPTAYLQCVMGPPTTVFRGDFGELYVTRANQLAQ